MKITDLVSELYRLSNIYGDLEIVLEGKNYPYEVIKEVDVDLLMIDNPFSKQKSTEDLYGELFGAIFGMRPNTYPLPEEDMKTIGEKALLLKIK